jgi:hypothetical protein
MRKLLIHLLRVRERKTFLIPPFYMFKLPREMNCEYLKPKEAEDVMCVS